MSAKIVRKRGDTFAVAVVYGEPPIDITAITIASRMRRDAVTVDLAVLKTNAVAGEYTLTLTAAQTAAMAAGEWDWDIQYTGAGVVSSTPGDANVRVRLIDGVTA
jgi:hypothetical protein